MTRKPKKLTQSALQKLSFEQAFAELEAVISRLEEGTVSLDHAVEDYHNGMMLQKYCHTILADAKLKVDTISDDLLETDSASIDSEETGL